MLLQIDELLQGAGGGHAPGPVAADEPRAARRFAHTEGEQDGSACDAALRRWSGSTISTPPPGSMAVTVVRLRISMPRRRGGEAAGIGGAARAAGGIRAGRRRDGRNGAARRPAPPRVRSARCRSMPSSASRCAAERPGGPAAQDDDLDGSCFGAVGKSGETAVGQGGDLGAAIETLAAPHHDSRAALQPAEIAGGQRARQAPPRSRPASPVRNGRRSRHSRARMAARQMLGEIGHGGWKGQAAREARRNAAA